MSTPNFPALSCAPKSVTMTPVDNTIKSSTDAGYVLARPRTTRALYDFDVTYLVDATDKGLLLAFDAQVTGATIFNWTYDGTTYQVRFSKRINTSRTADMKGFYPVSFSVQSV